MSTSRHGKHKESKVLLGSMVEPEQKAIAILTAAAMAGNGKPISQVELIWTGISNLARQYGVLDSDGKVTAAYSDAFDIALYSVLDNSRKDPKRKAK